MASPTKSKHGVYYYVVRVPKDLVDQLGASRISETLRTKDPEKAKERFAVRHARSLHDWNTLRSEVRSLSHKEVIALSGVRYRSFVEYLQDDPGPASELRHLLEMSKGVDKVPERLETWYAKAVGVLLLAEGVRVDPESRVRLMQQMHRADVQAISQLERNAKGDYRPDPDAARFPAWSAPKPDGHSVGVSFNDLFALWERDHIANDGAPKTIKDFRHKVDSLAIYHGHTDAQRVTHVQLAEWCDHLRHEEGRAARTVRDKYLAAVKAIYRLGMAKGKLAKNPARDVTVRVPPPVKTRSKGFSDTEAAVILLASLVDPSELGGMSPENKLAVRWVPWMCAYTGARVREISQLRKEDLIYEAGVPCIRITPAAGSVKTRQYRLVPVHQHLIDTGLLALFAGAREGPLFFTLKGKEDDPNRRAESVTKKLAQWVRKTMKITDVGVMPNHAWRHRFKTIADDVGMDAKYSDALQGHSDGRASTNYGERSVKALNRELQKMPRYRAKA